MLELTRFDFTQGVPAFDAFREQYESLSADEQRDAYTEIAHLYPVQCDFSLTDVLCFMYMHQPQTVIELGGWDGRLAYFVGTGTSSWRNYEFADVPQVCTREGYEVISDRWIWDDAPLEADAFVASHVLEHLSLDHLRQLLAALKTRCAYIECPLGQRPHDWTGFLGTHVLPLSIHEFDQMWADAGWVLSYRRQQPNGYMRYWVRPDA